MTALLQPSLRKSSMTVAATQDPTPRQIIASARDVPAPARGVLLLGFTSALLMWASFTPLDFSPLAWVCLVPMLVLVRLDRPTGWMYPLLYLSGVCFWLPTMQWMRLGDPSMYIAWGALSLYLAIYFPLFVGLTRVATRTLRIPLVLSAPAVWVGLEYARAYAMTGISWYYLAHSQYRWLELIQISDVCGAYGVSFVVVSVSAALSLLIPQSWMQRCKLFPPSDVTGEKSTHSTCRVQWGQVGMALLLFGVTLGYGYWRRSGEAFPAGPRVAAIQGNFPTSVHGTAPPRELLFHHRELTGQAMLQQPDVVVWPEGMLGYAYMAPPKDLTRDELKGIVGEYANRWDDKQLNQVLANISEMANAALVIGAESHTVDRQGPKVFNSALLAVPEKGIVSRYDKIHRVPFGEYLPLYDLLPFLSYFSPYRGSLGLNAGQSPVIMEYKGFRYAPVICFEDTIPHLVREAVNFGRLADPQNRKPDVLLNLTNDGWFHGSSELDQHLITAAFRSVECRTPMVRAVNTGISAVIDGDGAIRKRATDKSGKSKQVATFLVEQVPLDRRTSLYVIAGDWFAASCLLLSSAALCIGLVGWVRNRRRRTPELPEKLKQKLARA